MKVQLQTTNQITTANNQQQNTHAQTFLGRFRYNSSDFNKSDSNILRLLTTAAPDLIDISRKINLTASAITGISRNINITASEITRISCDGIYLKATPTFFRKLKSWIFLKKSPKGEAFLFYGINLNSSDCIVKESNKLKDNLLKPRTTQSIIGIKMLWNKFLHISGLIKILRGF